ncbi:MAG: ArsR/SmtB family transcription factor [Kiritimatiellia bacterium]
MRLARILKLLSVPARLRILRMLRSGALCVNALTARLRITQGAVSQHLAALRRAGIVRAERRGCYVHYMLNDSVLLEWGEVVRRLFEPAGSEIERGGRKCAATGRSRLAVSQKT